MSPQPQPGTLGKYNPIASLGKGGMANVYLALMSGPSGFNKLMVVKELRDDSEIAREELVSMFLDEARLAAQLHHRNIVQTYEFGEVDGRCYMAMEYLEGQTLRSVQRKRALPLDEEVRVLAEIARGLHYAHELRSFDGRPLSVVHRDVSPQNVFLTYDGQVKLLDFGIAKIDGAEHLTKVGAIKGKIDYIAPEQIRSESLDRRADVFSLGAMLWEAVTHERFGGGRELQEFTKIHRRLAAAEPRVRDLAPNTPEALLSLVEESLALEARERVASAAVFADRLDAHLATLAARPTDNSLAAFMTSTFGDERRRLRERVENQIKRVKERGPLQSRALPSLVPGAGPDTASGVLDLSTAGSMSSADTEAVHVQQSLSSTRKRPGRAALLAASIVAITGAAGLALRDDKPATSAALQATPATVASAALAPSVSVVAQPPAAKSVRFSLSVSPGNARVTLDGAPLPAMPFAGEYLASKTLHRLEASAEGYLTDRRFVTFEADSNIQIELVLDRSAPRTRGRRGESASGSPSGLNGTGQTAATSDPPPPLPSGRAAEPAPGQELKLKPTRQSFDMNDPYAE